MFNSNDGNKTAARKLLSNFLLLDFDNASSSYLNKSVHNSTDPYSVSYFDRHVIGMLLALGGNLLISISLNVQKKAHNRLRQESQFKYCVDKWWWFGMILMGLGEGGNFMAYGFAPASLVAPLGSLGVIANAVIAVVFLHEPLTMPSMLGVTLVVIGSVILVSFSVKGRPVLTSAEILLNLKAWPFVLYITVEVAALGILLYLKYVRGKEQLVILLLLVAIVASVTIIAAKAVSTMISETIIQGKLLLLNPVFFIGLVIIPITTATQIRFLNRAMQLYNVSDVVPINFMFFTTSAILAGAIFYQEFYNVEFDRVFMFLFGVVQSIIGVYIITKQDGRSQNDEENTQHGIESNHGDVESGNSDYNSRESKLATTGSEETTYTSKDIPNGNILDENFPFGDRKESINGLHHQKKNLPSENQKLSSLLYDLLAALKNSNETSRVQPLAKDIALPN